MQNVEFRMLRVDEPIVVKANQVQVETGIVWLTQSGHREDIVLFADQSHRPQGKGRVVIEALNGDARVILRRQPHRVFDLFWLRRTTPMSTV